jgi:parallel beta-helix repeat protein
MATIFLLAGAIFIFSGEDRITDNPSHSSAPMKIIPPIEPDPNVKNENTGIWYETIQAAIDAASFGHRLVLYANLFEENVVVDKSVMISGNSYMNHIVDGGSSGHTITIEADGVVIRWLKITNDGGYAGIKINSNNNFIIENQMDGCKRGVDLSAGTSDNGLYSNDIKNSVMEGIYLYESSWNFIVGNTITGCPENGEMGILLADNADNNTINANTIQDNNTGVFISSSSNNLVYHNNFFDNFAPAHMWGTCTGNHWDRGYLYGGNYWSDHTGVDHHLGPYQNIFKYPEGDSYIIVSNRFIDTAYYIPNDAYDRYPLKVAWDINNY